MIRLLCYCAYKALMFDRKLHPLTLPILLSAQELSYVELVYYISHCVLMILQHANI